MGPLERSARVDSHQLVRPPGRRSRRRVGKQREQWPRLESNAVSSSGRIKAAASRSSLSRRQWADVETCARIAHQQHDVTFYVYGITVIAAQQQLNQQQPARGGLSRQRRSSETAGLAQPAAPVEETSKPPPTPSTSRRQQRSQQRLAAFLRRKRLQLWAASILKVVRQARAKGLSGRMLVPPPSGPELNQPCPYGLGTVRASDPHVWAVLKSWGDLGAMPPGPAKMLEEAKVRAWEDARRSCCYLLGTRHA